MVGFLKFFRVISIIVLTVVVLMGCQNGNSDDVIKIGITQIVEHPALDRNREGFIKGLESRGFIDGENIKIDVKNAQGDTASAQLIADTFVSNKVDLIMAIATPTAQAAKNATMDHDIPVVFSAVTDPLAAGLVNTMETPGENVTGTSDMTPISKQFELIKSLFPNKTKVGIIFNTGESNSQIQVDLAKSLADEKGLTIIEKGITSSNEIQDALISLLPDVDVLYVPTDNTVASAMPVVIEKATELNIPVIGSEKAHVESGALITEGIDYFELGFQTGLMAADILEGKDPKSISVETLENTSLVINLDTAQELNITIPDSFKERGELIESGE
ncbi:ABC transporter substrate-binding protein [Haloplasma contractile]|uniref:ABC transporter substrate-binding protein n=1 Tax=Haloplasma contractile SSD-17B TaxID=1033810 RepID=U2DRG5_9MOLU|nr:ABC transporter substrate-binding protein [Haloplasma contractile]ERJ11167.1 ABC transporter substrate-binding protein [Haloplasma contractile SSD-17B]